MRKEKCAKARDGEDNCSRARASTGAMVDKGNMEPLIMDFSRLKVFNEEENETRREKPR